MSWTCPNCNYSAAFQTFGCCSSRWNEEAFIKATKEAMDIMYKDLKEKGRKIMGDSQFLDQMRTDVSETKQSKEWEERPKKTYEQLEAELKRVKTKSSARKRNLQGLNAAIEAYVNLNRRYWGDIRDLRKSNDELRKQLDEIRNVHGDGKAYIVRE